MTTKIIKTYENGARIERESKTVKKVDHRGCRNVEEVTFVAYMPDGDILPTSKLKWAVEFATGVEA